MLVYISHDLLLLMLKVMQFMAFGGSALKRMNSETNLLIGVITKQLLKYLGLEGFFFYYYYFLLD